MLHEQFADRVAERLEAVGDDPTAVRARALRLARRGAARGRDRDRGRGPAAPGPGLNLRYQVSGIRFVLAGAFAGVVARTLFVPGCRFVGWGLGKFCQPATLAGRIAYPKTRAGGSPSKFVAGPRLC